MNARGGEENHHYPQRVPAAPGVGRLSPEPLLHSLPIVDYVLQRNVVKKGRFFLGDFQGQLTGLTWSVNAMPKWGIRTVVK